ncbi:Dihydroxyacetone synthase [Cyphellophora attinorum]|uniref:Dihydroxyacetone synthase n=1 Tax=Cyphellophora attinorum TaxID=1664694 RepID=A0A0N0NMK2_9EURO|nr:Dihydroxyacetone synthase [Phialophora attinorum]KPI40299.1 Dihydroxyacetone synthase [Phialophora attinorum]
MAPPTATADSKNGANDYSKSAVKKVVEADQNGGNVSDEHALVLKTLRVLVADLCQQFKGGHPGGAIGMMAIGIALWKYTMRYAPRDPTWINRDRFILSNGHCCIWQYVYLHMTGFNDMSFDQLKSYHSDRADGLCPGHPEIEHEGVEVTTGPLGQGVANAVGLAMASKNLAATFNTPDYDIISNHIWCTVGDACLQEGVGLEAISLGGHWRLNNLTIIYDNNQITCDGAVDITNTEDINAKMRACGYQVIDIMDGNHDVELIVKALELSKKSDKPTFINVRTIIGLGSDVAGQAVAHGAAFKPEDVAQMKKAYGFKEDEMWQISQSVRDFFSDIVPRGKRHVAEWNDLLAAYGKQHPELHKIFVARIEGNTPDWEQYIPKEFPNKATATRAASGLVLNPIVEHVPNFIVGTADLTPSVNMKYNNMIPFNSPDLNPSTGPDGSYSGRYIHYGIREHAMCAISNGIAAWGRPGAQTFIPITSSFFMFYIYCAAAVRMGALQRLQVIHAATHDSIGTGEDGPTHQPLELAALSVDHAIKAKFTPSIISTSRHGIPQFPGLTSRDKVAKGAYVIGEDPGDAADITLIGVGPEFNIASSTADLLRSKHNLKVRLVSFPCQRLFDAQPRSYQRNVLQRHTSKNIPAIVVEAYTATGWEKYADAAVCMSKNRFGQSLPGPDAYKYFGYTADQIAPKVQEFLKRWKGGEVLRGEFEELVHREEYEEWDRGTRE